jgi:serine/threonine-protein kinase
MGVVLDVRKEPAGIDGAMKVLLAALADRREFAVRFLEEARLLATLRHPNIVEVIDYDMLADGTPFMVMKRLRGQTLRACLRDRRRSGRFLTAHNAWAIAMELCGGLQHLHSQHPHPVVHRDVKPENMFIHAEEGVAGGLGTIKLLDFGLAGAAGQGSTTMIGTPRYMAPELLRREAASEHVDQYSAALVIYEMLTGRLPWDVDPRDTEAMAKAHLTIEPAAPSRYCRWLPPSVNEAIVRALAKRPTERWASVGDFANKLGELRHVDDGSADASPDANTTAPTLATLAGAWEEEVTVHDTAREAAAHPMDGPSLEVLSFPNPGSDPSSGPEADAAAISEVTALLAGLTSRPLPAPPSGSDARSLTDAITRPYGSRGEPPARLDAASEKPAGETVEPSSREADPPIGPALPSGSAAAMVVHGRARRRFSGAARRGAIVLVVGALMTIAAIVSGKRASRSAPGPDTSLLAARPSWLETTGPLPSEPPPVSSEPPAAETAAMEVPSAVAKDVPATQASATARIGSGSAKSHRNMRPSTSAAVSAAPDDGRDLF